MKNSYKFLSGLAVTTMLSGIPVFADGLVFDPAYYSTPETTKTANASTITYSDKTGNYVSASTPASSVVRTTSPQTTSLNTTAPQTTSPYASAPVNTSKQIDVRNPETRINNNLQNALFELDSAQTDERTTLQLHKSKYSEIDAQYQSYKEQRKAQKKLVKDSERKIKHIEKTKTQIRKNMQFDEKF